MPSILPYDIGCEPSPSVPAETLVADGWKTFLIFFAVSKTVNVAGKLDDLGVAILRCDAWTSRFGYPNDEGLPEHPLYNLGLNEMDSSVLEIVDSTWVEEVRVQTRASAKRIWRDCYDDSESNSPNLRHFMILLKEATFECVAESMTVERYAGTFDEAFRYVSRRVSED